MEMGDGTQGDGRHGEWKTWRMGDRDTKRLEIGDTETGIWVAGRKMGDRETGRQSCRVLGRQEDE